MDSGIFLNLVLESYYDELAASHNYLLMAEKAPTEEARRIHIQSSRDEYRHAENFQEIYEDLTGKEPSPTDLQPISTEQTSYVDNLKDQLFDEYTDTNKYKYMYLLTANSEYRNTLFNAMQDELTHTLLDTYLLNY